MRRLASELKRNEILSRYNHILGVNFFSGDSADFTNNQCKEALAGRTGS